MSADPREFLTVDTDSPLLVGIDFAKLARAGVGGVVLALMGGLVALVLAPFRALVLAFDAVASFFVDLVSVVVPDVTILLSAFDTSVAVSTTGIAAFAIAMAVVVVTAYVVSKGVELLE